LINGQDYDKWVERFIEYCEEKKERPPGMAFVRDISLSKSGKKRTGEAAVTKI